MVLFVIIWYNVYYMGGLMMKKIVKGIVFSFLALSIIIGTMSGDDGHDPELMGTNIKTIVSESL